MLTVQQSLEVAFQHHRVGRLAEAEALYRNILAIQPRNPDALHGLGFLLHQTGHGALGVKFIREAISIAPLVAALHNNLGTALKDQNLVEEAISAFNRALELRPDFAPAYNNLGNALRDLGHFDDAVSKFQRAIALQPNFALAYSNLGNVLADQGRIEEAIASFRQVLEFDPNTPPTYQNFLTYLQYSPQATLRNLRAVHEEFDRRYAASLRTTPHPHRNTIDPDRPLRLGFVSPHFASHAVGRFLVQLLEHLDSKRFHVICYSNTLHQDAMTARIQRASSNWREVPAMSDEELARTIRNDGVDILFDLAGHTSGNRLLMFARKPAPIQITWLDYVGTTGLAAMDYILADAHQIPVEAEDGYTERVLRMPHDYICFDPPATAPLVDPLPALATRHVTFGSFNILAKITSQMIECWARILHRVPGSRMLLKTLGFEEHATRCRIEASFAKRGIASDRVDMLGWTTPEDTLACYNRVDIGLDTFPYNGGLTTCEALWMGVPVVTCAGETFASRHGFTHLSAAGLSETIARDLDHYVDLAVHLANDLPQLATMRATLRQKVAASPLCDGLQFANYFGALMRDMWRQRCESQKP